MVDPTHSEDKSGSVITRRLKARQTTERCVRCHGHLTEIIGPFGIHFGKVGCEACRKLVRWLSWPDDIRMLALITHSRCRSCRAPVRWIELTSGKKNPVDPRPRTFITNEGVLCIGFESHFATCPDARTHRRQGGQR